MTTYQRGDGWPGHSLSQPQIDALQALYDKQNATFQNRDDKAQAGLGTPLYQLLLSYISQTYVVEGVTYTVPLPGVNQAVFNWIYAAQFINNQDGFAAKFIAQYTIDQKILRDGPGATTFDNLSIPDGAQEASNQIALNVIDDILTNSGTLPGIEGLGVQDAGGAASTVFKDAQYSAGDYAGWAGTLLFPYLGEPQYYVNWLLNTQPFTGTPPKGNTVTFKNTAGTYDLVAALNSANAAAQSATGGISNKITVTVHSIELARFRRCHTRRWTTLNAPQLQIYLDYKFF
jgi:hypothetical protein